MVIPQVGSVKGALVGCDVNVADYQYIHHCNTEGHTRCCGAPLLDLFPSQRPRSREPENQKLEKVREEDLWEGVVEVGFWIIGHTEGAIQDCGRAVG